MDIDRFESTLTRTPHLRDRLFTVAESTLPLESLAARFAAKEALAKALGAPAGLAWHHAEVVADESGAPRFVISGTVKERALALGVRHTHLSLSHDGGVATAFVVAEC